MPIRWETYPIQVNGGLITNISPIQLGLQFPGAARRLVNFEPSIQGGYRRINGYNKYDSNVVPSHGDIRVQGSGQTGTNLLVANIFSEPAVGETFTLEGNSYTVSSVTYSDTNKEATITLGSALVGSPADKAALVFDNPAESAIGGVTFYEGQAYAHRDDTLWRSTGSGWTKVSVPNYGTTLVDGAGQTGTNLVVDGLAQTPQVGDTFSITGVEKVYTVLSAPTVTSGAATLSIYPTLASSPADNAAITWLSFDRASDQVCRFEYYNYDGTRKMLIADSENYPMVWDGTNATLINGSTDVLGAEHVVNFKDHMFYSKGDDVFFSAPFEENNFNTGDGAGTIRLPDNITGMINFRDQLIIFTESSIHKLTGSSLSDFALGSITTKIGCVAADTIQEVGGDIMFMGPDGLRLLSATDRIGDFGLAVASRAIQPEINVLRDTYPSYCSVIVRDKSQYRIFGFQAGRLKGASEGYIGTQYVSQDSSSLAWSKLVGIKARVACSIFENLVEYVLFAGEDGYVYRMESGNTFDGSTITSTYYTPYLSITDPVVRKTIFKSHSYFDPEGDVVGTLNLRFNLGNTNKIQPGQDAISNGGTSFAVYGSATYGSSTFGEVPTAQAIINHKGSGFTVSLEYQFENTAPFVLDTILIEFEQNDRR